MYKVVFQICYTLPNKVFSCDISCYFFFNYILSAFNNDLSLSTIVFISLPFIQVQIIRISEGAESSTFKQYFHEWAVVSSGVTALLSGIGEI